MMKRIVCLIFYIYSLCCFAQTEHIDSVILVQDMNIDSAIPTNPIGLTGKGTLLNYYNQSFRYNSEFDPLLNYKIARYLDLKVPNLSFISGQASIFPWKGGELIASVWTAAYPGLMQIDTGSIGIYQRVGSFTFRACGVVNKYGYFQGLHTQYGLNGSVTYQINPKISVTAFGTYYFGVPPVIGDGLPMTPAMVGCYGTSKVGGHINYDAGAGFGVLVGGQAVQQVGTQRYESEPIVTPYIKVGRGKKKVAIGLPVGQILHGLLKR